MRKQGSTVKERMRKHDSTNGPPSCPHFSLDQRERPGRVRVRVSLPNSRQPERYRVRNEQLSFGVGGEGEPAELSTTGEVTNPLARPKKGEGPQKRGPEGLGRGYEVEELEELKARRVR